MAARWFTEPKIRQLRGKFISDGSADNNIFAMLMAGMRALSPFSKTALNPPTNPSEPTMRYAFRLAELLGHTPDRKKRPGTIKAIVEYTGLDRHQVAALL